VYEAIVESSPDFGNALDHRALPDSKTCQKFTGETEAQKGVVGLCNDLPGGLTKWKKFYTVEVLQVL